MILIQCTKSKRDEPAKAKNMYDESQLFRAMWDYAQATGEMTFILSAKHGLLDPEREIEPYNQRGISEHQAKEIADEVAQQTGFVEIIAGEDYTNHLIPELEKRGVDVVETCAGLRYANRVEKLKHKTAKIEHKTL